MPKGLLKHPPKHCLLVIGVLARVPVYVLDAGWHAHLAPGDVNYRVDQIQVWQLAINAIVNNMHRLESMFLRIIKRNDALQQAGLERQRIHLLRVVRVVVCIDPCLSACPTVRRDEDDNVLGPERPPCDVLFKVWSIHHNGRRYIRLK